MVLQAWTDYPITQLGDIANQLAPIRLCRVLAYDRNKYCVIQIGDVTVSGVKRCYLYKQRGRVQKVPILSDAQLKKLPTELKESSV